eukprot:GGOE01061096.1.p1 GENE.GGOE01061096.1~~GGOE01061096.1.p1  ORF type:complete len:237 (+),score=114.84 GGOE01061096.1:46-711(+)
MADEAARQEAKALRKAEKKRLREEAAGAVADGVEDEEAKKKRKLEKAAKKAKKEQEKKKTAGSEASVPNPNLLGAKVVTYANDFTEVQFQCAIAKPYSPPGEKLTKKILQLVNEAYKVKAVVNGIKLTRKALSKNVKGICVMAANVAPLDVISHMPAVLEDANCPYIWVPSRYELGLACMQKRAVSVVLIKQEGLPEAAAHTYEKVKKVIKEMQKQCFIQA